MYIQLFSQESFRSISLCRAFLARTQLSDSTRGQEIKYRQLQKAYMYFHKVESDFEPTNQEPRTPACYPTFHACYFERGKQSRHFTIERFREARVLTSE